RDASADSADRAEGPFLYRTDLWAEEAGSQRLKERGVAARYETILGRAVLSSKGATFEKEGVRIARGFVGARYEHHVVPHHEVDDARQEWIVRATEDERVDVLLLQWRKVVMGDFRDLVARRFAALHELDEARARCRREGHVLLRFFD